MRAMAAGGTAAMAVEAASAGATAEAPSSWVVVMAAGWAALAGVAVGGVVDELAEEMGAAGVQAVVVAGLMVTHVVFLILSPHVRCFLSTTTHPHRSEANKK